MGKGMGAVKAIAVALPFGLHPSHGTVSSELTFARAGASVEAIADSLAEETRELAFPAHDLPWFWTSDVAAEGVCEVAYGQPEVRGKSPLIIVKATRQVRSGLIVNGIPFDGARGDTVDLGKLAAWEAAQRNQRGELQEPPPLEEALSPVRLLAGAAGCDRKTPGERLQPGDEDTDRELFTRTLGAALSGPHRENAIKVLRNAGWALGGVLDAPIALTDPQAVVLAGFTSRAGEPFVSAVRDRLARHDHVEIQGASGIAADNARTGPDTLKGGERASEMPHQYWPTLGAAHLALERCVRSPIRRLPEAPGA